MNTAKNTQGKSGRRGIRIKTGADYGHCEKLNTADEAENR